MLLPGRNADAAAFLTHRTILRNISCLGKNHRIENIIRNKIENRQ
jgi:hypothetical protein